VGLTSNRVFRMAVAPVGQFSLVRKPSKLRGLLRQFDIRLVDHLGISRGVRGIEICKLAGAHRFEWLQGLPLKRVPDAGSLEHLIEPSRDLVDDRLWRAAWGDKTVPRDYIDLGIARLCHRRHIGQQWRARGAEHRQCPKSARVNMLCNETDGGNLELHPV